jgi:hypothetical protein
MNTILETGIALVLVFFIFSIITYVIQELIAANLKLRGKMLWKAISQLLDDAGIGNRLQLMRTSPDKAAATTEAGMANLVQEFYGHGHILRLHQKSKKRKLPSYIPAANFALTVIDMVAKRAPNRTGELLNDFKAGLQGFVNSNGDFMQALKSMAAASTTLQELQERIEKWFDEYMNRVSGWYQSHTLVTVRIIAVAVTLVFNLNTLKIADTVYHDGQLRTAMVAMAENIADQPETVTRYYDKAFERQTAEMDSVYKQQLAQAATKADTLNLQRARDVAYGHAVDSFTRFRQQQIRGMLDSLQTTGLPMGWKGVSVWGTITGQAGSKTGGFVSFFLQWFGWFITAAALSMGAPFWFDMLGKLVNLRRAGQKPGTVKT